MGPTFDPGFSTPEMTAVFSAAATVEAILEFEAALALALADAELAPAAEAGVAAEACAFVLEDPEGVLAAAWTEGTPLPAITSAITARIDDDDIARWVHFGATTQDAVDSARMIQSRRGMEELESSLRDAARHLRDLVIAHRDLPQMGRTFLQEARPVTFGFRTARWLSTVLDRIEDLGETRRRLPAQLGGPAGMPTGYGTAAAEVVSALSRRLELAEPLVPWHVDRSPIRSIAATVESTALTASQIAEDLALLAQSSIGEVSMRPGGSSSMPEKKNPVDAVRVVAATRVCVGAASVLRSPSSHQLDRGIGGWHSEWVALPLLFHTAGAAVEALGTCLETLEVDAERMSARVEAEGREPLAGFDPRLVDRVLERFERVVGAG